MRFFYFPLRNNSNLGMCWEISVIPPYRLNIYESATSLHRPSKVRSLMSERKCLLSCLMQSYRAICGFIFDEIISKFVSLFVWRKKKLFYNCLNQFKIWGVGNCHDKCVCDVVYPQYIYVLKRGSYNKPSCFK